MWFSPSTDLPQQWLSEDDPCRLKLGVCLPRHEHVGLCERVECLNAHWLMTLEETRSKMEDWHKYYNEVRPHGAKGTNIRLRCRIPMGARSEEWEQHKIAAENCLVYGRFVVDGRFGAHA